MIYSRMLKLHFILIFGFSFFTCAVAAQEVLPKFTLNYDNGKVAVSWLNKYPREIKGISVQRSYDSTKGFSSVANIPFPESGINGFMDNDLPYNRMYYRLFINFDSGAYIFTESKTAEINTTTDFTEILKKIAQEIKTKNPAPAKVNDVINNLSPVNKKTMIKALQDSPGMAEAATEKSRIYVGTDNNVIINIPDFEPGKYIIKFYDDDNKMLFQLNKLKEAYLTVEKVNFRHAGWFYFEIYADHDLMERGKFYIPKDENKNQ